MADVTRFKIIATMAIIILFVYTVSAKSECAIGEIVQDRQTFYKDNIIAVMSYEVIQCDGLLTEWNYWAGNPGRFRAMVVRPIVEDSKRFHIVGINDITVTSAMDDQITTYRVPNSERFGVQVGDMIAVAIYADHNPHLQSTILKQGKTVQFSFLDPTMLTADEVISTRYTGNIDASIAAIINITDTELPVVLNTPSSKHVNTDHNSAAAIVWWTPPTASDNSGEPVTLISGYNPGDIFSIGNTTVTDTAVDVYGNVATDAFNVVVTDIEPPEVVNIPASKYITTDHNSAIAAVWWTPPTASDNSGEPVTLISDYNPGDIFTIGTTTVTYRAEDIYGNLATDAFTVVVTDIEPPEIVNTPSSKYITTDPNSAIAAVWWKPPTASDNSGEAVTLTSDYHPGDIFTIGITKVTYTAVDLYGNMATDAFNVVVTDAEPPLIGNTPSSQNVNTDPNSDSAVVWWTPLTASDNSDEPVTLTSNYIPGDNFTIGITTVTYVAVDVYGNIATYAFDVKVTDVHPPAIVNTPSSRHVNTDPNLKTATVWWMPPTTSDNSGEPVTLTSDYSPGDNFSIGITTVTYTAVDVHSNKETFVFDVLVADAEPPVIVNTPSSQHVNMDPNSATVSVWWTPPKSSDNSGEPVTLTSYYHPGDNFTTGNTTVTYTAVDFYGNVATYSFYVEVIMVTDRKLENTALRMIVGISAFVLISFVIIIVGVLYYRLRKSKSTKNVREETELKDTRRTDQNEYQKSRLSPTPEYQNWKPGQPESCYYDDVPTKQPVYHEIEISDDAKGQSKENYYDLPESEHGNGLSGKWRNRDKEEPYQNVRL